MLAIQSGSNAAAGRRARDVNVLDDSPARRTRQRLGQQDAASAITTGTSNAYMWRLFGAQISTMKKKKPIILTKKNGWFWFRQLRVAGKVR